jgi:hypothetical protein
VFDRADFRGIADFGQTALLAPTQFDDARFHDDASFRSATVSGGGLGGPPGLSFFHTVADRQLDLSGSGFTKPGVDATTLAENRQLIGADLSSIRAATLRFDDAEFQAGIRLRTQKLSVGDLHLGLGDFGHLSTTNEEERLAGMIEASAKARGDLALANDAEYELRLLEAQHDSWPVYALDSVFYRGIAGYFVRPFRPLLTIVALAFAIAVLVQIRRKQAPGTRGRGVQALAWSGGLADELVARLSLILPQFGKRADATELTTAERFEAFTYRVLLVCALIGFANSNPTLRQMLDALH